MMKKLVIAFALVATLAVALFTTGSVYAQGTTPTNPAAPGSGNGYSRGRMGSGMMVSRSAAGEGILHDAMIAVYAEKLGISVDDLNARLANSETMAQIASSKGLSAEQFTALMTEARSQAIDQAVKDGTLTQAQADWMKERGAGTMGAGRGTGRGTRGSGAGDPANCPVFNQTTQ